MAAEEARMEAERLEEERKRLAEDAKEKARLERESLAAEGAEKSAIRAEVETLVKETNSPKSADELLDTYAGKEDELLANLRKMKADQESEQARLGKVRLKMEKAAAERAEYMAFMKSQE